MKEIAIGLGAIAVALGVVGAVIFGAKDTALFVPPPEAVAENFGRELATGRYELARRHLSDRTRRNQSAVDLKTRFEPWKSKIAKLNHAQSMELSKHEDRATAICELQGEPSAVALTLQLVREQGLWMVDRWEAADVGVRR